MESPSGPRFLGPGLGGSLKDFSYLTPEKPLPPSAHYLGRDGIPEGGREGVDIGHVGGYREERPTKLQVGF